MSRLIVVSNRVSVAGPRDKASAGGLAVALYAALRRYNGVWFGWSGEVVDAATAQVKLTESDSVTVATTDLSRDEYEEYYNGFANRVLWPILHYRLDLAEFTRRDLGGYFRVNEFFAGHLEKTL
ncbi:MAG TPA: trehalose-6-phosphate synthase, partial [Alphaproteobacteria bacterium]|nr:trehalose-6-phosphate synthase [Alphaproteobacteria bacterium]